MRLVIRADASSTLGAGHIVRCLALAGEMRRLGASVTFVCRPLANNLINLIVGQGFSVAEIAGDGLASEAQRLQDAELTKAALNGAHVDWIIVDHYHLDLVWESAVRTHCHRVAVIDDLADREHDCDVLIDSNILFDQIHRYEGLIPADCAALYGPEYVLLREEFQHLASPRVTREAVQRTLVMFGGYDASDLTSTIVEMLPTVVPSPGKVHVVVGLHHPRREHVRQLSESAGYELHTQTHAIAELMRASDIAISACGLSAYELVALGVPSILIAVSPIQEKLARSMLKIGLARSFPSCSDLDLARFRLEWTRLAESREARSLMSATCRGIIDGRGTHRVAMMLRNMDEHW